jgi:hypothetical protein
MKMPKFRDNAIFQRVPVRIHLQIAIYNQSSRRLVYPIILKGKDPRVDHLYRLAAAYLVWQGPYWAVRTLNLIIIFRN